MYVKKIYSISRSKLKWWFEAESLIWSEFGSFGKIIYKVNSFTHKMNKLYLNWNRNNLAPDSQIYWMIWMMMMSCSNSNLPHHLHWMNSLIWSNEQLTDFEKWFSIGRFNSQRHSDSIENSSANNQNYAGIAYEFSIWPRIEFSGRICAMLIQLIRKMQLPFGRHNRIVQFETKTPFVAVNERPANLKLKCVCSFLYQIISFDFDLPTLSIVQLNQWTFINEMLSSKIHLEFLMAIGWWRHWEYHREMIFRFS